MNFLRRARAAMAASALGLTAVAVVAPPAAAGPFCTSGVTCGQVHHAVDDGYDPPIIITCDWNTKATNSVPENTSSTQHCRDADGIYIRSGEQLRCFRYVQDVGVWWTRADATGWHKITDDEQLTCVLQVD